MWDLYLIRASVEGIAARRVTVQASSELPVQLEALIARMLQAAERQDPDELTAYDVRFHELIIDSGGSRQLQRMWRLLHPQDWTIVSVLKLTDVTLTELARRHRPVLEALVSRDPDWAETVIRRHILELARRVLSLSSAAAETPTVLAASPEEHDRDC
jgi:DNA-binding GntR family transcriptional regulator